VDAQSRRDANPLYFGTLLLYPNTGEPLPDASPAELTFAFETRAGGRPITGAAVELRRGGAPLVRLPLPLSPPDEQGRLQQVSRLAVEGMTPGAYELHVIVEAGPSTVSRSVSFTVVGDRGRAPLQPQPFRARVV
jgi:hypothetical protein